MDTMLVVDSISTHYCIDIVVNSISTHYFIDIVPTTTGLQRVIYLTNIYLITKTISYFQNKSNFINKYEVTMK